MNNDFLPKDYKEKTPPSNYTKLEEGETVLRILDKPIMGWQGWEDGVNDKQEKVSKPVRVKDDDTQGFQVDSFDEEVRDVKFFWAMPVWNYNEKVVQIWVVTQASIRKALVALSNSKAWGNPIDYDISVTRTGKEKETKYSVMPTPKEVISPKIQADYLAF